MNSRLSSGSVLRTEDGAKVSVEGMFGFGGQGEVYKVSVEGRPFALKWYYPEWATPQQRMILEGLVGRQIRDPRFLWPRHLVTGPRGFGYLMDVRPDRFIDLPRLFKRDRAVRGLTPRTLLVVALNTAEAFRHLHVQGISYRDISWGNLFFDPRTGEVLVCDNDNAVFEGAPTSIGGTMQFMAPELVRNDPGAVPCTQTDLHALAVLLFMLLMNHHPLDGAAALKVGIMDDDAWLRLNGTDPVFVFDPKIDTNRPVPGEQDTVLGTWAATPPILRALFEQAFTVGLQDPGRRVAENQWRDAFRDAHDAVVVCANCQRQNMVQPGPEVAPTPCWSCKQTLKLPPRLEISSGMGRVRTVRSIRLSPGAKVLSFHLRSDPDVHDFEDVVAEVVPHPTEAGRLGLRNKQPREWMVHREDARKPNAVPMEKGVMLREGLLIEFGEGAEGVFRAV
ncbi:protein kinase domain-containing protein [Catenulispora subtropica]|uniref:Protein kinase domain-containing protein n=1 Tax=Catenulispora subtropica TaxID=450798 RepID=A0ABP5DUR7_9ACTN